MKNISLMRILVNTVNKELCDDASCKSQVPINPDNDEVFDKLKDGVALGKLINIADPDSLSDDFLKTGDNLSDDDKNNNLEKVADGENKLGLPHKATPVDIRKGRKKEVQDLLIDVLARIKVPPRLIKDDKGVDDLVQGGETKEDLATKVPVKDFVQRWANKHLKLGGSPKQVNNLGDDLKDGEIYTILMNNVDPDKCDKSPLDESNPVKRM